MSQRGDITQRLREIFFAFVTLCHKGLSHRYVTGVTFFFEKFTKKCHRSTACHKGTSHGFYKKWPSLKIRNVQHSSTAQNSTLQFNIFFYYHRFSFRILPCYHRFFCHKYNKRYFYRCSCNDLNERQLVVAIDLRFKNCEHFGEMTDSIFCFSR